VCVHKSAITPFEHHQMAVAPRNDAMGPGNSGFIFIRSNAKTKVIVQRMCERI
jgi:hypothetical protein